MGKLRQVISVGLLAAACGCSSGNSSGGAGGGGGAPATVSAADVSGVGRVLVDVNGMALYSPDEEASGTVLCVDACTSFWIPLAAGADAPTAAPGTTTVGVIGRPDGTQQVTADGHPLYTFSSDRPGTVTGNGFMDAFGAQSFTWHVILADGTGAGGGGGVTGGGGGAGGYGGYGF